MDNNKKQNKKEYVEGRDEKMSSTFKVVMITVISTLLIIAVLLLLLLFGMKKCQGNTNSGSSEPPIDTERNNKISDVFKDIVKKQMITFGFDEDELKNVNAISYKDNYPSSFSLNITVTSGSKVYYYMANDINYPSDKNGYDNFLSYLLLDSTSHSLIGDIDMTSLEKSDISINTTKETYKAVIGTSTEGSYLSGFTYEEDSFSIYQKRLIVEGNDPFLGVGDQKISNGDPLYNYYQGLLA